ncbi:hypothetical protein BH10PSE9_BH10PSE9_05030 [soil metagenome]
MKDQQQPSNTDNPMPDSSEKPRRRHPAFGLMKGTVWIAPGVDLTEPAMPEWADMIDEKYGKAPK